MLTAFELLLDGRSQPLAVALDQAFEDALSKDDWLRMSARSSMPILLTGWRSGLYTGSDVYKQYSEGRTRYPEQASE